MPRLRIERRSSPLWVKTFIPIIAIGITFLLTSVLILWAKANPFEAYFYFFVSPLSSRVSALEVLVKSTPLLLTGAAVTLAFTVGYWNIGVEGQLLAGAIAAAGLGMVLGGVSPILAIPVMLLGGFIAGLSWALIPAILKVKLAVDEVVTTLLMNTVILFLISFLLNGVWRDPISGWPQSPQIVDSTVFPKLIERSRLHIGFLVAWIVVGVMWIVFYKTPFGLRMRAVGLGQSAANFVGVNVNRTVLISALVSGGIAGLAGVSEVAGIHFHLIEAISPGYGYGIIVALLGGLNPLGMGAAALFIGLIETGAQSVSRALGVPIFLGNVVEAVLLLVTLSMLVLQNYPGKGDVMEIFIVGLVAATLRVATPLIFGTLGELISERAGILNLGIEGTMFLGSFVGFTVASLTGSLWLGFLAAVISGVLAGLLMALLTVGLGLNQHVSGLGLTLFLTGISLFAYRLIFGERSVQPSISSFPKLSPLGAVPILGPIFEQYALTFLAFALVPIIWWLIYRTSFGLQLRAVGENPEAGDAAGVDVFSMRYMALGIAGGLMAAGGAFLSLAQLGSFIFGIVAGRGWVCIALVIFANWHPVKVFWGALLFGGVFALQLRLQATGMKLPYELFLALPYLVTIVALTIAGRNAQAPAALLKAYRRE